MLRPAAPLRKLVLPLLGGVAMAAPALRQAPDLSASPANQLVVAGNACGPAALLNAFRCGNPNWQRASRAITGSTDKDRLLTIIRGSGMRPSHNLPGHPRWSRRGVSVADLTDMANELTIGQALPPISSEVFFLIPRESPDALLRRVHQRLDTSLAKGLPPVLSLRRYALRSQPNGNPPQWTVIDAHFVTLTAIPRKLDPSTRRFPVTYIDPWGGKICQGAITIPDPATFTDPAGRSFCLEADFPQSPVGKSLIRHSEPTTLTLAAAVGRW